MSGLPVPTPPINVKSVEPCFDPPMVSSSASSQGSALLLVNACVKSELGFHSGSISRQQVGSLSSDASKSTKLEHSQCVYLRVGFLDSVPRPTDHFIPVTASRLWHSPAALRRPNLCQITAQTVACSRRIMPLGVDRMFFESTSFKHRAKILHQDHV
ncbi:hypothetical protein C8J57DRAFT_1241323 [Mycena rebaudengoi]|nr:hypothetical protein C8J57DRAFT_1241323 [Mycena rebaudengoi]